MSEYLDKETNTALVMTRHGGLVEHLSSTDFLTQGHFSLKYFYLAANIFGLSYFTLYVSDFIS